jgi:hypothetical protein
MLADLDLLLTAVFCTADDLLPEKAKNARRSVTDAEVVTLAVAQAIMGVSSDDRFLRLARRALKELFPKLPQQSGFHKRRAKLTETIEWLIGIFAEQSPGYRDDLVLIDSTPVECARSVETVRRSALSDAAGYGYCRSHSRWFYGFRLHLVAAPDGTPRAAILAGADHKERDVALRLLPRALHGGELVIADKGYAGREFEHAVADMGARLLRPNRKDEPDNGLHLSGIRQRIESIFWTCKDLLTLERHGARTLHNLRARIATRLLALAAAVWLNHQLGRPTRSLITYTA